jgi:hypothetical protein
VCNEAVSTEARAAAASSKQATDGLSCPAMIELQSPLATSHTLFPPPAHAV